jgi:transcriptional regulator with XRE-family HTH domain
MAARKKKTGNTRSPKEVDVYVGARIRSKRMLDGMSQEKLGDSIGLTFQQVQKYEKGSNRVGASRLLDIADALGVTPGWFFEGMPGAGKRKSPVEDAMMSFMTDPYAVRIVTAFPNLALDVKKALVNLAERTNGS